jgi:hypothetical protein
VRAHAQQLSRLRRLIGDPLRRQRLIFGFSLLSFAIVSLLAYLVDIFMPVAWGKQRNKESLWTAM